ncbi:hypothetical protein HNV11_02885 [Spirosoma taeanense]|uniref:Porin n=1 Tax=Spirosoma taeanense TaxID=2735870 RepID=A0A6M5Y5A0_9BACT|nr:hypothetical protein [Spirosoma taeanense]QJW88391.1 hypothetical protein HNV11_02885 [Spirosoma taeanense]
MKKTLVLMAVLNSGLTVAQQPAYSSAGDTLAPPAEQTQRRPGMATRPSALTGTTGTDRNELKYNLNASGSHFFKVTFMNQTWLRFNQSNPGTTVVQEPKDNTFDIGLRRTRIQAFGQISNHVFLYFQFGMNNFNYLNGFPAFNTNGTPSNRKVAAFFHDALAEYLVFKNKDYLKIGAGLTIVNGLSRFSQPSVTSIVSMDVPVFAQATVDQTDQFSRKLSLYARGQVGPVDYRVAISDPFPIQTSGATPPTLGSTSNFALKGHKKQFQGLFLYQFFDKEAHQTPGYMTGTYLGKKKILNLEAGFITQKNAMWRREGTTDTTYQNLDLWSVATFLDMPVNRATGTAVNAYLGYFNLDYGTDYLRFNGIMNPASGTKQSVGGLSGTQGNAFPMFGTGKVVYGQFGYLMRQDLFGGGRGTLLPYVQAQLGNYQRVTQTMGVYNLGVNYLINGHNSKLTLDYQNRPYYETSGTQIAPAGRRGQLVLQYQVFI